MTTNQIRYAEYLRDKRTQRKTLKEQKRHNVTSENEVMRHNQVTELQGGQTITETNRHNVAMEGLQDKAITTQAETARYSADTSAAASMYAANVNAAAHKYAADTAAEASKYASDTQSSIAQLNADIQRITTLYNNESAERRNDATNLSKEAMNAATNATNLTINATNAQINAKRVAVEKAKADAEKAYKEGKIKVETFNSIVNACDSALDYLKYLFPKKGVK